MAETEFPKPGDWSFEDPSDSSCGRYCHPDGCADNHPTFTYQICGPDWADDDWGSARCVSIQHAALMASAPDMYAALKELIAWFPSKHDDWHTDAPRKAAEAARAALAKARGESQ